MIYLDNAATTKPTPSVISAMEECMSGGYGNPGSKHQYGRRSKWAISKARESVAKAINAKEENIVFTSSGSEANAMVFKGLRNFWVKNNKSTIVVSAVEHESILKSCEQLESDSNGDITIKKIRVDKYGVVDINHLKEIMDEDSRVGLVSVMYVNNEVGSINDVKSIAKICHDRGILFHTDCVQAMTSMNIDVQDIDCDFLTFSAHKIHGPMGVGILYVRNKDVLTPLVNGGSNQEYGLRGGTENVPGIVGAGVACDTIKFILKYIKENYFQNLKRIFVDTLKNVLNDRGFSDIIKVNGLLDTNTPILNLQVKGIDSESLVLAMNNKDIMISSGSACNSGDFTPSHVLTSMGLTDLEASQSVRISMSLLSGEIPLIVTAASVMGDVISGMGEVFLSPNE